MRHFLDKPDSKKLKVNFQRFVKDKIILKDIRKNSWPICKESFLKTIFFLPAQSIFDETIITSFSIEHFNSNLGHPRVYDWMQCKWIIHIYQNSIFLISHEGKY